MLTNRFTLHLSPPSGAIDWHECIIAEYDLAVTRAIPLSLRGALYEVAVFLLEFHHILNRVGA